MSPVFIFDLGKVLVDFDYTLAARKIAARGTQTPADLHSFLGSSPLLSEFECGRITRQDFFEAVRAVTGFLGPLEEFGAYFAEIFTPIPSMIELQADLRRRGFKTYIFSNTNDLAIEHVRHDFPFFQNFNGHIYSYEVGAMKPEPKIYEAMEAMSGKRGADLIYIDDREENIAAGQARGWRTIHHETPEKTRQALIRMGI
jgi:FMN phosphatase YigB (HAD superfamily)